MIKPIKLNERYRKNLIWTNWWGDMKHKKVLLALSLMSFISFASCAHVYESHITYDTASASYPKHRIDNLIRKVGIIGTGEGKDAISSKLTELFMDSSPNIEVIEPGSLESILGGRIIEYETGLTRNESQALAQMLQADHVLIFDTKMPPHLEYKSGGRFYVQISLKIINIRSGKIIFQTVNNWGVYFPNPKRYLFEQVDAPPSDQIERLFTGLAAFELHYALGNTDLGTWFEGQYGTVVLQVLVDSPADRAGIEKGDRILEIDGFKVRNYLDVRNYHLRNVNQGDSVKIKIERGGEIAGEILEVEVKYPVIPFAPVEEKPLRERKGGKLSGALEEIMGPLIYRQRHLRTLVRKV